MIRVTITLVPHGDEGRAQHMHTIEIANDGTGTQTHGDYMARVGRKGVKDVSILPWRQKAADTFPRLNKNVIHLLARVLKNLGYA